jgi:hypothetical protein
MRAKKMMIGLSRLPALMQVISNQADRASNA